MLNNACACLPCDSCCRITRAVVYDEDLYAQVFLTSNLFQLLNHVCDSGFLVESRNDDADWNYIDSGWSIRAGKVLALGSKRRAKDIRRCDPPCKARMRKGPLVWPHTIIVPRRRHVHPPFRGASATRTAASFRFHRG